MARQFPTIQQQEVTAYAKFCALHNIINDGSADDQENASLVVKYFTETWNEDMNDQTLALAFPQLKSLLKFDSAARIEARRIAKDFPDVQALGAWFDTQTFLVKEGDDGFRNITELMLELQGRSVTPANIDSAIMSINATQGGSVGRFSTRRRRPLIYVQKKVERKKSFHELTDDGVNSFSTSGMVKQADGSFRSKTYAEQKRDAEAAAEKAKATTRPSKELDAWQVIAQGILGSGGSHGRNASLQAIYDLGTNGQLEWRQVATQMQAMKKSYDTLLSTARY
jgi:hypothetical protein